MMDLERLAIDIRRHEGLRLKPYQCTAGKLTIGYGRNLTDAGISEAEAEMLLRSDLGNVIDAMDRSIPWWRDLHERQQLGLAEMGYQLGIVGVLGFRRMLAALKRGDAVGAYDEALRSRWAEQTPARARYVALLLLGEE